MKNVRQRFTSEQRSEISRKGHATRRERMKSMTPEEQEAARCKAVNTRKKLYSEEQRTEWARRVGTESSKKRARSALVQKAADTRRLMYSLDEHSARARKGGESARDLQRQRQWQPSTPRSQLDFLEHFIPSDGSMSPEPRN